MIIVFEIFGIKILNPDMTKYLTFFTAFFIYLLRIDADGCRNYRINNHFEGDISNCPELVYGNTTNRLKTNPFEGCQITIRQGDIICGSEVTRCYNLGTIIKVKNIDRNETKLISLRKMLNVNEQKWLVESRKNQFEQFWFSHYMLNSESKFYKLIMNDGSEMTLTPSHNVILKDGTLIMSRKVKIGTELQGNVTIKSKKIIYEKGYANLISDSGEFLIYSNNRTIPASCYAHVSNKFIMDNVYKFAKYFRSIWQTKNGDGELLINSVGLFFQNLFV